jgi:hypothetical protein
MCLGDNFNDFLREQVIGLNDRHLTHVSPLEPEGERDELLLRTEPIYQLYHQTVKLGSLLQDAAENG